RVLAVGRESGQVRTELPADLQLALVTAVRRTLDEWSVADQTRQGTAQAADLSAAQLDLLHRMLATDRWSGLSGGAAPAWPAPLRPQCGSRRPAWCRYAPVWSVPCPL